MRLLDRPAKVSTSPLRHMRLMALGLALLACAAFGANPPPSDRILSDLSRCDRAFFATLGQHAGDYASNPHFRTNGTDGYFAVNDRFDQKLSIRKFSPALKIFDAKPCPDAVVQGNKLCRRGFAPYLDEWLEPELFLLVSTQSGSSLWS